MQQYNFQNEQILIDNLKILFEKNKYNRQITDRFIELIYSFFNEDFTYKSNLIFDIYNIINSENSDDDIE